ncbi:MFS transporter [Kitasatospora sp. NPDC056138]|uniref:MFS transporter n=1 Tax=Kitasatospora sp. NPDC056138 TaxID=3345724 RepID=UPI0035DA19A6
MRVLLADRNARLHLFGQTLSSFGDSALWLALGVWIKMLTGSASAAGLSFFAFALGTLGGPLGGMLADRVRRRPLLIAVNLATAALVLLLLLVRDQGQLWLVYTVMFGYGLSAALLGPAQTALLQTVVPDQLLGAANSALQTLREGMRLVTPLFGAGLLTAFGATPVIVGDAVTFLVAVAALLALRVREERPEPAGQHPLAEAVAGARHIRRTAALRQLTVAGGVAMIAFGFSETALFAVVDRGLHRPAGFLGALVTAQGVGAIAAGWATSALIRRVGEGRLAALGLAVAAAGFLLLATPWTLATLAGSALVGCSLPWITVGIMTLFQRRTPPALMGRTDAALGLVRSVPQTVAIAVGAALVAVVDYRVLLSATTGLLLLASAYLATRPELRPSERTSRSCDSACNSGASANSRTCTASWKGSASRQHGDPARSTHSPAHPHPTVSSHSPAASCHRCPNAQSISTAVLTHRPGRGSPT